MVGGSESAVAPTDGGAGRDVGSGFDGVGTDEFAGAGAGACADACAVSMCSWVLWSLPVWSPGSEWGDGLAVDFRRLSAYLASSFS